MAGGLNTFLLGLDPDVSVEPVEPLVGLLCLDVGPERVQCDHALDVAGLRQTLANLQVGFTIQGGGVNIANPERFTEIT